MTEFGFIDGIKNLFSDISSKNIEGIGDDCAIIPLGDESLLMTSDMLIEDIHFLRESTSAYDLGYKSLAVNLSDVAAMGVRPTATLLSISIPKELMGEWVEEFMQGYHDLSKKYDVPLIGGDTTASKDRLSINVTAIGRGKQANIKRRQDAKVGDLIVTNGELGESGAGLKDILKGEFSTPNAMIHKRPEPQVPQGEWLGQCSAVHAMMDISDGVASDIRHIMSQSKVGAKIDIDSIPTTVDTHTALCGGEDYKLLLTVNPLEYNHLSEEYRKKFNSELHVIGEIVESTELQWIKDSEIQDDNIMGFRHY